MSAQPRTDCAFWKVKMRTLAKDALCVGYGVAEVEGGDGVEDELQGIGPVSARAGGEAVLALGALEKWKRLKAVATPAFLYRIVRLAFRADGVLLFGFSGGHEQGVLGLDIGQASSIRTAQFDCRQCRSSTGSAGIGFWWAKTRISAGGALGSCGIVGRGNWRNHGEMGPVMRGQAGVVGRRCATAGLRRLPAENGVGAPGAPGLGILGAEFGAGGGADFFYLSFEIIG